MKNFHKGPSKGGKFIAIAREKRMLVVADIIFRAGLGPACGGRKDDLSAFREIPQLLEHINVLLSFG